MDIVWREHTLKGLAFRSALIERTSTSSHICAGTGSLIMLLVLIINRYWAQSPDGYGAKATPLQGSPDIINVLCVWQRSDPMLIQLHVAYTTFQHGKRAEVFVEIIVGMHRPK